MSVAQETTAIRIGLFLPVGQQGGLDLARGRTWSHLKHQVKWDHEQAAPAASNMEKWR